MENPLDLVERFDEITPQWLTNALRKGGVVKNATVESVDIDELGPAAGFMTGSVINIDGGWTAYGYL